MSKAVAKKPRSNSTSAKRVVNQRRSTWAVVAVFAVFVGAVAFFVNNHGTNYITASAQTQFCAQNGTGYCLNDWNGGGVGNPVNMYRGNTSNEDFSVSGAGLCGGHVTSTCPFSNSNYNGRFSNDPIVYIKYNPRGLCLGSTATSYRGLLEPCGSGFGTYWVQDGPNFINRYWTNVDHRITYLCSGGVSGGPVFINGETGSTGNCQWR